VLGRRHDSTRTRRQPFPFVTSVTGVLAVIAFGVPAVDLANAEAFAPDEAPPHPATSTAPVTPEGSDRTPGGHQVPAGQQVPGGRHVSGMRVVGTAAEEFGHPYRYGADGPAAFDCSGLTQHVFQQFGVHLPHNSAAQYRVVEHVPKSQMRLGDLVFVYDADGIYHVGIYAGGDRMWAASNPGEVVRKHDIWTDKFLVGRV
jgi:cell wall-associated NlpC family hydrolase